jgi:hypothetical protein
MIKHRDSHVDHGLSEAQIRYLLERFADRSAFFIETITLPIEMGTVPCGLYGPLMGDSAINDDAVTCAARGTRHWTSRLTDLPARQQHEVTVVAGPHEEECPTCRGSGRVLEPDPGFEFSAPCPDERCKGGKIRHACVLYTAYGGPVAPQEPGDPGCKDVETSTAFWRQHALAK